MARILKAIEIELYDRLMQIHRANEIHRLQAETCSNKIGQESQPSSDETTIQDGGGAERSSIVSPYKEEGINEETNDDVNADNNSTPSNNSTLRHLPISPSNQLQARSIQGWTALENIAALTKRAKRNSRKTPIQKTRNNSHKGKKKKTYRC